MKNNEHAAELGGLGYAPMGDEALEQLETQLRRVKTPCGISLQLRIKGETPYGDATVYPVVFLYCEKNDEATIHSLKNVISRYFAFHTIKMEVEEQVPPPNEDVHLSERYLPYLEAVVERLTDKLYEETLQCINKHLKEKFHRIDAYGPEVEVIAKGKIDGLPIEIILISDLIYVAEEVFVFKNIMLPLLEEALKLAGFEFYKFKPLKVKRVCSKDLQEGKAVVEMEVSDLVPISKDEIDEILRSAIPQ